MRFLKENGKYYEITDEQRLIEDQTDNDGGPLFEDVEVRTRITKAEYEDGTAGCGCH